jgi:type IV secretory pathway VirB6-like protein
MLHRYFVGIARRVGERATSNFVAGSFEALQEMMLQHLPASTQPDQRALAFAYIWNEVGAVGMGMMMMMMMLTVVVVVVVVVRMVLVVMMIMVVIVT